MKPQEIIGLVQYFRETVNNYGKEIEPNEAWESIVAIRNDIFSEIDKEFTKHFLSERWYTLFDRDRPWRELLSQAEKAIAAGVETGDKRVDEYKHQSDILVEALQFLPGINKFKKRDFEWIAGTAARLGFLLQPDYQPPDNLETLYDDFKALKVVFAKGIEYPVCLSEGLKPWIQIKLHLAAIQIVQKIWVTIFNDQRIGHDTDRIVASEKGKQKLTAMRKQHAIDLAFTQANRRNLSKESMAKNVKKQWAQGWMYLPSNKKEEKSLLKTPSVSSVKKYLADEWEKLGVKLVERNVLAGKMKKVGRT